jgi:hypothetical protein
LMEYFERGDLQKHINEKRIFEEEVCM